MYVHETGSKPLSISPLYTFGKQIASQNLDKRYLATSEEIDEDARMRALSAFLADFVVDTGELDLTIGRKPGRGQGDEHTSIAPLQHTPTRGMRPPSL